MDVTIILGILILFLTLVIVCLGIVLVIALTRKPQQDPQIAASIQTVIQSTNTLGIELRELSTRTANLEQSQQQSGSNLVNLGMKLAESGRLTQTLSESTSQIQNSLVEAQKSLASLQEQAHSRQEIEQRSAESIRRLEAIIAGTYTKGAAGENIIEVFFSQIPPDWQIRNFQVGNKTVEFGLRLPNNLVLPIDSKWAATDLLETFLASDDPARQQQIKGQIERVVREKAREVKKYLDPNLTVDFGIAVVPDAVLDICAPLQVEMLHGSVVLVSYSMFLPYLLLVFQTVLKNSHNIDLQKIDGYLNNTQHRLEDMQVLLEGKFSKATTSLENARGEMRSLLSGIQNDLVGLRSLAGIPQEVNEKTLISS